jgi:uncharacterized membrane protein
MMWRAIPGRPWRTAAPAYGVVTKFLLPLAVPLLLLTADMRSVLLAAGRVLGCFAVAGQYLCREIGSISFSWYF